MRHEHGIQLTFRLRKEPLSDPLSGGPFLDNQRCWVVPLALRAAAVSKTNGPAAQPEQWKPLRLARA